MAWNTEQGKQWRSMSNVAIGDPTRASWGNDRTENIEFERTIKAPFVRGHCVAGDDDEPGSNGGSLFSVVGYAPPSSIVPLVDVSEYSTDNGFRDADCAYKMIHLAGDYGLVADLATAKSKMPGGSGDESFLWNSDLSIMAFYSGAGHDAYDDSPCQLPATAPPGSKDMVIFVPSSSFSPPSGSVGGDALHAGDLAIYNLSSTTYLVYHYLVFAGPKWKP